MELQKRKEILDSLNNKLKRKKYISLLLALFTLGVNIFAWFVFSSSTELNLNASVSSWDVKFNDGNDILSKNVIINITNMHPGMEDFFKTYTINNRGDVSANFSFNVESIELLGKTIDLESNQDSISYFNEMFPFNMSLYKSKDILNNNESLEFSIDLNWDYENTDSYFSQANLYEFNPTFSYYTKNSEDIYVLNNSINSSNFTSNKNDLYIDKDDADTYFGMMCKDYEKNTGTACLKVKVTLTAEQIK